MLTLSQCGNVRHKNAEDIFLQFSPWTSVQIPSRGLFIFSYCITIRSQCIMYFCKHECQNNHYTLNQLVHFIYDVLALEPVDEIHEMQVEVGLLGLKLTELNNVMRALQCMCKCRPFNLDVTVKLGFFFIVCLCVFVSVYVCVYYLYTYIWIYTVHLYI